MTFAPVGIEPVGYRNPQLLDQCSQTASGFIARLFRGRQSRRPRVRRTSIPPCPARIGNINHGRKPRAAPRMGCGPARNCSRISARASGPNSRNQRARAARKATKGKPWKNNQGAYCARCRVAAMSRSGSIFGAHSPSASLGRQSCPIRLAT